MAEGVPAARAVGCEFVRQYYTMMNECPSYLNRFYGNGSCLIHDDLTSRLPRGPVYGREEIRRRISQLGFQDCRARIHELESHYMEPGGVVIQVVGELSNRGKPMRGFVQTVVLVPQGPRRFYVFVNIFKYLEDIFPAVTPDTSDPSGVNLPDTCESTAITLDHLVRYPATIISPYPHIYPSPIVVGDYVSPNPAVSLPKDDPKLGEEAKESVCVSKEASPNVTEALAHLFEGGGAPENPISNIEASTSVSVFGDFPAPTGVTYGFTKTTRMDGDAAGNSAISSKPIHGSSKYYTGVDRSSRGHLVKPTAPMSFFTPQEALPLSAVLSEGRPQTVGNLGSLEPLISVTSTPAVGLSPLAMSFSPLAASCSPRVTYCAPFVMSSVPLEMSSLPLATSSNLLETSSTPLATSSPLDTSYAPLGASSAPIATTSTLEGTSSTPLIISSAPLAASTTPISMSSTPLATASTPLATASTPLSTTSTPLTTVSIPPATHSALLAIPPTPLTTPYSLLTPLTSSLNSNVSVPVRGPNMKKRPSSTGRKSEEFDQNASPNVGNSDSSAILGTVVPRFPDENQLFIGNLPHDIEEEELRKFFGGFGVVVDLRLNRKPVRTMANGLRCPNFGFVVFEDAATVQDLMRRKPIMFRKDQRINIEKKKTKRVSKQLANVTPSDDKSGRRVGQAIGRGIGMGVNGGFSLQTRNQRPNRGMWVQKKAPPHGL